MGREMTTSVLFRRTGKKKKKRNILSCKPLRRLDISLCLTHIIRSRIFLGQVI